MAAPGSIGSLWGWAIAVTGSILLNVILFGLMPGLIQRIPASKDKLETLEHIQVIRVKKKETPPPRKPPEKIAKPKPIKQIQTTPAATRVKPRKITLKPRLAFELNSHLPAAPMDIVMPALEHFSMEAPILKANYDIGELDTGLIPLVKIPPIYPLRARRRGIQGFVTLGFTVTNQGFVDEIRIIKALPEKIFNKSVLACVSQWKFKTPTVEGIPVATKVTTTIRFKLEK